jgi:aldose 1-epimerase
VELKKESFGKTSDGHNVDVFTLVNKGGMEVTVLNFGGRIIRIRIPDRKGILRDVILGHESMEQVLKDKNHVGVIVGRYANRIAKAEFTLDGKKYRLAKNDNGNHLHGGVKGFDMVLFSAELVQKGADTSLKLAYLSKDGEEGYPGNLNVAVYYNLTQTNELSLEYEATTDKRTVINLTNHMYFNLADAGETDILRHVLTLNSDKFTPIDAGLIPIGELASVKGTPMDFSKPVSIGERVDEDYQQLKLARGYDHNWVLNKKTGVLDWAARVYDPGSGRALEIITTEPGIQFYSGNFLDGTNIGRGGKALNYRHGFCLEPQHFPDSPNQPAFPSTVLDPGKSYFSKTVYKFSNR